jgi:hypothetical protein
METYDTAKPFASLTMKQTCRSIFGKGGRPCCLEFIFFKVYINFEFGGVPMPLTGAIPEGPSFFCPHCGALYAVTYSRLFSSDSNVARCVVCGQIMDKWDSTKVPTFKLVHRPEDH